MKLPDFPWDALAPYGQKARAHSQGFIDLSQGTPVDPTPDFIQEELKSSSNSPSYPLTTGSASLREALKGYCVDTLGASGDFDVLPTLGSKELVALLAYLLEAKSVLIPEIAYPTYKVGALLAKAEVIEVGIDAHTWPDRADLAWINSPSNPTGRVHSKAELEAALTWVRKSGATLASDECYLPFTNGIQAHSILEIANGDNRSILALHSLSKRSNMAGYRGAFVAGDSKLIARLLEIRKHMGMMLALPIQNSMAIALSDHSHVEMQAGKYQTRRVVLAKALIEAGFKIEFSEAGLYIWCSRDESDWQSVAWFADLGILVTPGSFYGVKGDRFVRIALTASDENISCAASRIFEAIKHDK
ncbi:MAG: succinyldiaminopimelate transaminase [Actinobacteria bacterium]|nr:succinyldiaminopimelate transaminase [Actinomycetota bacterium]NBQ66137.1 succinyldiaminopimelate transaminase [Actinomycetota bacterium]NCU83328.1 succinyldiaminopimelate transaminase [Actinomycetota bacterium]NCY10524.1 succinyldiaminopimelate transaminase [Actinomycetota bacterium]